MLFCKHPFEADINGKVDTARHITADWRFDPSMGISQYSSGYSRAACDFIQRLGSESPHHRYSANMALKHPFIVGESLYKISDLPPLVDPGTLEKTGSNMKSVFRQLA